MAGYLIARVNVTDPDKYKNALVINLHGELLPMPALRNYSDAAKDPQKHAEWRVVTHPEELRTKNNDGGTTDSVKLRMYAYKSGYGNVADTIMDDPMVVEIVGVHEPLPAQPTPNDVVP